MTGELKKLFENKENIFFIKTSNRNKYFYKGKKANSRIWNIEKINASEFWANFETWQNSKAKDIFEEEKNPLPEQVEKVQEEEEIEEPKKSFFDRNIF